MYKHLQLVQYTVDVQHYYIVNIVHTTLLKTALYSHDKVLKWNRVESYVQFLFL